MASIMLQEMWQVDAPTKNCCFVHIKPCNMAAENSDQCAAFTKHWNVALKDEHERDCVELQVAFRPFMGNGESSPNGMLLLTSKGRIGAWMHVTGSSSRMCEVRTMMGARGSNEQQVLILLCKRIFGKFVEYQGQRAMRSGMDPMNLGKLSLLIGFGIPQLVKMQDEEALELCKQIEAYVSRDVLSVQ